MEEVAVIGEVELSLGLACSSVDDPNAVGRGCVDGGLQQETTGGIALELRIVDGEPVVQALLETEPEVRGNPCVAGVQR